MRRLTLFFATGFGAGYLPCTPGTFGTVVGMLIALAEFRIAGDNIIYTNAACFAVMLVPSIIIAGKAESIFGRKDAQQIVIDEIMGYWLSILFHRFTIPLMLAAFLLFRLFDIIKPFPIKRIQLLDGGLGVVADDLLAGVYVNICLWGIVAGFRSAGIAGF
jgi:phosphatidylglycerophosphatase A